MDGERFVLVVDLTKDFDSKGSPMLRIQYGIDSKHEFTGQWNMTGIYTYEKLRTNASNVANLKGRTVVSSEYRKIGEQWFLCGFVFSTLGMGKASSSHYEDFVRILTLAEEDRNMDDDQVSKHVEGHGKIFVSISRGDSIAIAKGLAQPMSNQRHAPNTLVSSKAVVKNNHVSHAIK